MCARRIREYVISSETRQRKRIRKKRRQRRRFRFRPSGNRTRSPPFLVFDPHQILPFPPVPICSPSRLALILCRPSSRASLYPLAILTLSVYMYYAKQVIVGGLGSQTRTVQLISMFSLSISPVLSSSSLHLFGFSLKACL